MDQPYPNPGPFPSSCFGLADLLSPFLLQFQSSPSLCQEQNFLFRPLSKTPKKGVNNFRVTPYRSKFNVLIHLHLFKFAEKNCILIVLFSAVRIALITQNSVVAIGSLILTLCFVFKDSVNEAGKIGCVAGFLLFAVIGDCASVVMKASWITCSFAIADNATQQSYAGHEYHRGEGLGHCDCRRQSKTYLAGDKDRSVLALSMLRASRANVWDCITSQLFSSRRFSWKLRENLYLKILYKLATTRRFQLVGFSALDWIPQPRPGTNVYFRSAS